MGIAGHAAPCPKDSTLTMSVLTYVAQGIGYGFVAAVQPGPFQTYLISQTLSRGWRRSLSIALAPIVSDGPIIALVLLALTQIPASLQRALYVAGGLFALYLARGTFVAWHHFDTAALPECTADQRGLLKAAIANVLSPGPYLYWSLVTGPILLAGWRESPINGIGLLAGFYAAMIGTLAGIVLLFGTARQLGPKVTRALLGVSAVALACFGVYQLWLGIRGAAGG